MNADVRSIANNFYLQSLLSKSCFVATPFVTKGVVKTVKDDDYCVALAACCASLRYLILLLLKHEALKG